MIVNDELCTGCGECPPYCPVGAITLGQGAEATANIDQDACVECGVCLRVVDCPGDAIEEVELGWPRGVRAAFSNPVSDHRSTLIPGRGTEEMKTNDVTGRFRPGVVGVAVEVGRPGVSASFSDVQVLSRALAEQGVVFEPDNPLTALMSDPAAGRIDPDILNERVLSAIIEFTVPLERLPEVLGTLKETAPRIDTVFSLGLISLVGPDGKTPIPETAESQGYSIRPNTKTNIGLGRPLADPEAKQ